MGRVVIWHNPRCRKSREGFNILKQLAEEKGHTVHMRKYLDDPPSATELRAVLKMMNKSPREILRKQEKIWKEKYKGKELTDDELIEIMAQNPKLIERPIVIFENKAVLGRPAENIKTLFE